MKEEMRATQRQSKSMRKELGSVKRILKSFGERLRAFQYKRREVIWIGKVRKKDQGVLKKLLLNKKQDKEEEEEEKEGKFKEGNEDKEKRENMTTSTRDKKKGDRK